MDNDNYKFLLLCTELKQLKNQSDKLQKPNELKQTITKLNEKVEEMIQVTSQMFEAQNKQIEELETKAGCFSKRRTLLLPPSLVFNPSPMLNHNNSNPSITTQHNGANNTSGHSLKRSTSSPGGFGLPDRFGLTPMPIEHANKAGK